MELTEVLQIVSNSTPEDWELVDIGRVTTLFYINDSLQAEIDHTSYVYKGDVNISLSWGGDSEEVEMPEYKKLFFDEIVEKTQVNLWYNGVVVKRWLAHIVDNNHKLLLFVPDNAAEYLGIAGLVKDLNKDTYWRPIEETYQQLGWLKPSDLSGNIG
jgi:hypothetical protein